MLPKAVFNIDLNVFIYNSVVELHIITVKILITVMI